MTIENNNGVTVFKFEGSIDSSNSETLSAEVTSNLGDSKNVVFDFDAVKYISSAGLRMVLKTAKAVAEFKVINASSDVYEVFEMTGFTQIIKVSKALRVISIEGKELIGEGYMGKVYRLNPDTIIKVFYRNSTLEDVQKEVLLAKKAFVLGIPTAIPFDVVKVKEGGYGSVFELVKSSCMNKLFIEHPEKTDYYIKLYINVLKTLLSTRADENSGLPRKIDEAYVWFNYLREHEVFDETTINRLGVLLRTIPDSNVVIHGDYHIKNIMMQGEEPILIDMETLGTGHPIFEFTAFFLTYIGYPATDIGNAKTFLGIEDEVARKIFYDTLNEIYKDRTEDGKKAIVDKCALLGYMWLTYKTLIYEPENKVRLEHSKAEVLRLINDIKTLNF